MAEPVEMVAVIFTEAAVTAIETVLAGTPAPVATTVASALFSAAP